MSIKHRIGYDTHTLYSVKELTDMYICDGEDPIQAGVKAKEIYRALNEMRSSERRLWKRVRDNEMTNGLEPEPLGGVIL